MKSLLFIFLVAMIFSCSDTQIKKDQDETKNLPENFDFGTTEKGSYKNEFFGIDVSFDLDWVIQDKKQMNNLMEYGTEVMTHHDDHMKAAVKASMVNVAYLLCLFEEEMGASLDFNSSFMIVSENLNMFPGIKSGSDYLIQAKKILQQTPIQYSFDKGMYKRQMGNLEFDVLVAEANVMGTDMTQEYFAALTKGFCLSFILSYSNEEEKEKVYAILDGIRT